jgi:hypothetical protein
MALRKLLTCVVSAVGVAVLGVTPVSAADGTPPAPQPRLDVTDDWLTTFNFYRTGAHVPAVTEDTTRSAALMKHLTYLARTPYSYFTGPYQNLHDENPASPYYTPEGREAGMSSDLVQGASDGFAISNLITAPFHATSMLQPGLRTVSYASYAGWTGIDVGHGLTGDNTVTTPVLSPGANSAVPAGTWGGNESPDPLPTCGYQDLWSVGAPLVAMLPDAPSPSITASLVDDRGAAQEVCVVTADNYVSTDPVYNYGADILRGSNAAFVIPRNPLRDTRYTATIRQPGRADIVWSFFVDGYRANKITADGLKRVHVSDLPNATVMGNLTVVNPEGAGYTTAYPCDQPRPLASNNNYTTGQTSPNFAVVRSDARGDICVYTQQYTDVIWDQSGQTTAFSTGTPVRLLDTRNSGRVGAGGTVRVHVSSTPNATVMGNLTVVNPQGAGFTTAYPCDQPRPLASNNNYTTGQTSPNFAVVRSDAQGDICLFSQQATDLIWDQSGQTTAFSTGTPVRLFDSRVD